MQNISNKHEYKILNKLDNWLSLIYIRKKMCDK